MCCGRGIILTWPDHGMRVTARLLGCARSTVVTWRDRYRARGLPGLRIFLGPALRESVNDTLKGQLDLELHGGRTLAGVTARIAQRLLALTAAIWHNRATGQPVTRSLIAYDH